MADCGFMASAIVLTFLPVTISQISNRFPGCPRVMYCPPEGTRSTDEIFFEERVKTSLPELAFQMETDSWFCHKMRVPLASQNTPLLGKPTLTEKVWSTFN